MSNFVTDAQNPLRTAGKAVVKAPDPLFKGGRNSLDHETLVDYLSDLREAVRALSGLGDSADVPAKTRHTKTAAGTMAAVTLPLAASVPAGTEVYVNDGVGDADNYPITVARSGADTIKGDTSLSIGTAWGSAIFVSDGISQWFVF